MKESKFDFEDLSSEREQYIGWLSPTAEHFHCETGEHEETIKRLGLTEEMAEDAGWVRINGYGGGELLASHAYYRITQAQEEFLDNRDIRHTCCRF